MLYIELFIPYILINCAIGPLIRISGLRVSIARLILLYFVVFATFAIITILNVNESDVLLLVYKLFLVFSCLVLTCPALLTKSPTLAFFVHAKKLENRDLNGLKTFFEHLKVSSKDKEMEDLLMVNANNSVTTFGRIYGFVMRRLKLESD